MHWPDSSVAWPAADYTAADPSRVIPGMRTPALAPPRWLVIGQSERSLDPVAAYVSYLCRVTGGGARQFEPGAGSHGPNAKAIAAASDEHDVVVIVGDDQPLYRRLIHGPLAGQLMSAVRTSLLVARGPRWPLRRILAVTRGRHEDLGVAEWAAILAKSSGASITLQVVMPELPTACESYVRGAIMLQGRELSMPLGRQLQALRELHPAWAQTGVLRCRSGSPTAQVRREVADLDPDLVITGPDSASWLSRRLTGCLACGLVRDGERPVLVARSRSG